MELVLKHRAEIYGFLALWIMVFHLDTVGISIAEIPIFTNFIKIGNAGVDVFFFLSGYCLYLSLNRNSNVGNFFRKRFKRVLIVFLIIAIPFLIYKMAFETRANVVFNFFFDLSGLSFWLKHCLNFWFVHAIIVFYLFTIPFYHIIRKGIGYSIVLLLLLYLLNFIGHYCVPSVYEQAAIAYTRLPAYVFGMILADIYHRYQINERSPRYLKYIKYASIMLIAYLFVFLAVDVRSAVLSRFDPMALWLTFITIIFPVLSLWLVILGIVGKNGVSSFFRKVGNLSLEVYMIHILILHIFNYQGWQSHLGYWSYLIVPLLTFPLSFAANKLAEKISTRVFSPN